MKYITLKDAKNAVAEKLKTYTANSEDGFIFLEDSIIEREDYWVFFYDSAKFIETGNWSYALAGNAPLIVDKYEGQLYVTGTAHSIEYYMNLFEEKELVKIKGKMGQ